MKESFFIELCKDLDEKNYSIMEQASKEYANDTDKFANFKGIADFCKTFIPRLKDITPADVAFIYMMKHLISIMKGVSIRESMEGRHTDFQNYAKLLYGLWHEAAHEDAPVEPQEARQPVLAADLTPDADARPNGVSEQAVQGILAVIEAKEETVVETMLLMCKCGHNYGRHFSHRNGCSAPFCACSIFREVDHESNAGY